MVLNGSKVFEVVFGKYPAFNGDTEYLNPEVWAIDEDGEPIKRLATARTIAQAQDIAFRYAADYGTGYHIDDYSEVA